jgi:hypothetical protein
MIDGRFKHAHGALGYAIRESLVAVFESLLSCRKRSAIILPCTSRRVFCLKFALRRGKR